MSTKSKPNRLRHERLAFFAPCIAVIILANCILVSKAELQIQQHPLLCTVDTTIFTFLQKFLAQEFQNMNINVIYDFNDGICDDVSVKFHRFLSSTISSSHTVVSFKTLNLNSGKDKNKVEMTQQDKLIGHHTHQQTTWTELNLIFLLERLITRKSQTLNKIVQLSHFKRSNSFTIIWQRENRDENLLQLPKLQRLLKFKIEIVTDDFRLQRTGATRLTSLSSTLSNNNNSSKIYSLPSTMDVWIKSLCFYCDEGFPEIQNVSMFQLPILKTAESVATLSIPSRTKLFQDYTRNFNGRMIRVALSKGIPTMMNYRTLKNGRIETNGGFQTRLFHLVRRKLNFTYNITLETTFGLEGENGTFTGMVGAVQTGRAELGIGAAATQGRHKVVHYLTPNTFHDVTFITGNNHPLPEWQTIFLAFTVPLWFTIFLVATLLVYPTFVIANAFNYSELENPPKKKIITDCETDDSQQPMLYKILINGISYIFRPVFDQRWVTNGSSKDPSLNYNSVQMLSVFWLVGVLILGTEFKSTLVRLSVSPPLMSLPTTFYQLAQADDFQILTHSSGGSLDRIVRTTHSPTFDKISQKMKIETSIDKCIRETLKGKTACISYEDDAIMEGRKHFSDRYGHVFIHRAQTAFNFFASIILPKEAVYIESMETTVNQIVDMGITTRYHEEQYAMARMKGRRWAKQRKDQLPVYYDCDHPHFESLTIRYFLGPFLILLIGFGLAAISFSMENRQNDYVVPFQEEANDCNS